MGSELLELGDDFVKKDHDGLLGWSAGECVVDGIAPELHAHLSDRGVRDELRKPDKLEVESAHYIVGVLTVLGDEISDEEGIVVGLPANQTRLICCTERPMTFHAPTPSPLTLID